MTCLPFAGQLSQAKGAWPQGHGQCTPLFKASIHSHITPVNATHTEALCWTSASRRQCNMRFVRAVLQALGTLDSIVATHAAHGLLYTDKDVPGLPRHVTASAIKCLCSRLQTCYAPTASSSGRPASHACTWRHTPGWGFDSGSAHASSGWPCSSSPHACCWPYDTETHMQHNSTQVPEADLLADISGQLGKKLNKCRRVLPRFVAYGVHCDCKLATSKFQNRALWTTRIQAKGARV